MYFITNNHLLFVMYFGLLCICYVIYYVFYKKYTFYNKVK